MRQFRKQGFEISEEEIPGEGPGGRDEWLPEPAPGSDEAAPEPSPESPGFPLETNDPDPFGGDPWDASFDSDPWAPELEEPDWGIRPQADAEADDFWDESEQGHRRDAEDERAPSPASGAIAALRAHPLGALTAIAFAVGAVLILANRSSEPSQAHRLAAADQAFRDAAEGDSAARAVAVGGGPQPARRKSGEDRAAQSRRAAQERRRQAAAARREREQRREREREERQRRAQHARRHHEHAPAADPEPTYEEPTYEEPTYEEPTYEEPTYEEPTYEEPTYEAPAPEPSPTPPSDEFGIEP